MHTNAVCGGWMLACMLAFQGSNCHNTKQLCASLHLRQYLLHIAACERGDVTTNRRAICLALEKSERVRCIEDIAYPCYKLCLELCR